MRSTQKKGPRTLALKKARASAAEVITSRAAASVWQLYAANQAAAAALAPLPSIREIRAWIAKAAGYREPPEPEPSFATNPNKPPPMSGGAEACQEQTMENLEQLGQMAAAEWARVNASPGCDSKKFGENVAQVYRACLSPASVVPRPASIGTPPDTSRHPARLARLSASRSARSSAGSK